MSWGVFVDALSSRWEVGFSGLVEIQEFTWENARIAADGNEIEWNEELYARLRILKIEFEKVNRKRLTPATETKKPKASGKT